MLLGAKKKSQKKSVNRTICERSVHWRQRMAKRTSKALWRGVHWPGGNKRSTRKKNRIIQKKGNQQVATKKSRGAASQSQVEWQQGQWTRGRDRERDDQKVVHVKDLHCCEVPSGTNCGPDGIPKFVEDRGTGLLEETGRCPRRKGSEATEQQRWHRWCQWCTQHVLFLVWTRKKNLQTGRTYMLVERTV